MSTALYGIAVLIVAVLLSRWRGGRLLRALIHPLVERPRLSFFDAYPIGPEDVVLLGDSIAAGGEWAEIAPDARIRNRGIAADTSDDLLKRLEPIVKGRPHKVFVVIGTNDLGMGVAPKRIVRNLESIVDRLRDATPETQVYLHELFPRKAGYAKRTRALNAEIRRVAQVRSLPIVRIFDRFADDRGAIRHELTYDDLHLSGRGYQEWYAQLEPHLHEEMKEP